MSVWVSITDGRTDGRTNGPTDGRTHKASYKDARTHLKRMTKLEKEGRERIVTKKAKELSYLTIETGGRDRRVSKIKTEGEIGFTSDCTCLTKMTERKKITVTKLTTEREKCILSSSHLISCYLTTSHLISPHIIFACLSL